jgi:hypothetical protein
MVMSRSYDEGIKLLLPSDVLSVGLILAAKCENPFAVLLLSQLYGRVVLDKMLMTSTPEDVLDPLADGFPVAKGGSIAVLCTRVVRHVRRDGLLGEGPDVRREVAVEVSWAAEPA